MGRIALLVAFLAVLSIACGGGTGDPLVARLPTIVPQESEINEQVSGQWQVEVVVDSTGEWSNQEFADSEGLSVEEVADSGRIDGYRASFSGGPTPYRPMVISNAKLSVYRDATSAEKALRKGPYWATGPALKEYEFGDAAVAWPMSNVSRDSVNQQPSCPCEVWVRVGRLVGTVDVQFGGPPALRRGESTEAGEIARTMALRMADAQA